MKCIVPEISWHNRDPVLCVDVHHTAVPPPRDNCVVYRVATGGSDSHVVIWHISVNSGDGEVNTTAVSDLTHHLKPVNAVRFSPVQSPVLASADDDGNIIVWRHQPSSDYDQQSSDFECSKDRCGDKYQEHYSIWKTLRGHLQDVYDLCWSPDGTGLVSGAVDNTAIIWNVNKGSSCHILRSHDSFVQGVTWDPCGKYVATLGCDRHCRVFSSSTGRCLAKVYRCKMSSLSSPDDKQQNQKPQDKLTRLFHDDTLQTFCRRLSFSVDGNLLMAPAGLLEKSAGEDVPSVINVVHVFSRHDFLKPVYCMPTDKYTVAVRCCPVKYCLRSSKPIDNTRPAWQQTDTLLKLPYRMVIAVATRSSVLLFDTQQRQPFATVSNIHFTRLTDISWSDDGKLLAVSSTDGFCSLITFSSGELGVPYVDTSSTDTAVHVDNVTTAQINPETACSAELNVKTATTKCTSDDTEIRPTPRRVPLIAVSK